MPLFLTERDTESTELMDDKNCNRQALSNTYHQFSTINSMISGWKKIYQSRIKPLARDRPQGCSVLDIGFGGGDIPIKIAKWAKRDGISLDITAIETDRRAMDFVQQLEVPKKITFKHCSSTDMLNAGRRFDIVISNHLLHHLNADDFCQLLRESEQLCTNLVLFNDIKRSDLGYLLFSLFSRPVFRSSFITHDGLTSIRRSYTLEEIKEQVPDGWKVRRKFPFRLLLSYNHHY